MWEAPLVQVVMDKALTVLSNFKLSSGCELEALRCWLPKWRLFKWEGPLETGKSMKITQLSISMLLCYFIYT